MTLSRCPYTDPLPVGGEWCPAAEIITCLTPFLTGERRQRIAQVIAQRTYTVTPVMEGLYDRGNVSAVLRSAEALGYQAVHVIDTSAKFREANRVTQGAEKWLDISVWEAMPACIQHLKSLGYRVLATCFDQARPIAEFDFTQPTALVFGNEKDGVSPELLSLADGRVVVPLAGFSQSFNISVAAALCLYHAAEYRTRRLGQQGDLTEEEQRLLTAAYYLRSIPSAADILKAMVARRSGADAPG